MSGFLFNFSLPDEQCVSKEWVGRHQFLRLSLPRRRRQLTDRVNPSRGWSRESSGEEEKVEFVVGFVL